LFVFTIKRFLTATRFISRVERKLEILFRYLNCSNLSPSQKVVQGRADRHGQGHAESSQTSRVDRVSIPALLQLLLMKMMIDSSDIND
jgi:hypothetical protein